MQIISSGDNLQLSPVEAICMKCQNQFSLNNQKNVSMYQLLQNGTQSVLC